MPAIVLQRMESLADQNPEVYEVLKDLVNQLNQTQPLILSGTDHPDPSAPNKNENGNTSSVSAAPGTLYLQRNSLTGALVLHVKDIGYGPTGWAELGAFGSIPPTSGGGFQAVATPTTITFYYDGTHGSQVITLYRANQDQIQVPAGGTAVTGLTANTTYFFYPYFDERSRSLKWVAGNAGSPAIASTVDNSNSAQIARLTHHIPLTPGTSISITTPNVGSSPSSVGGGFGGRGRLA